MEEEKNNKEKTLIQGSRAMQKSSSNKCIIKNEDITHIKNFKEIKTAIDFTHYNVKYNLKF